MNTIFRLARQHELFDIWDILQFAIKKRKNEGSSQWQDGYPNLKIIQNDINLESAYVLTNSVGIIAYVSISINTEATYQNIKGKWLTNGNYVVFHRLAVAEKFIGKSYAKILFCEIENWALKNDVFSIKADTNFDNHAMLHLFKKSGYIYCGEVFYRSSSRKAFEKVLSDKHPLII